MTGRESSALSLCVVSFTGDSGLTDYSVSFCRQAGISRDTTLVTSTAIDPQLAKGPFKIHRMFRRSRHYPFDIFKFALFWYRRRMNTFFIFQGPLKFPSVEIALVHTMRLIGARCAVVVHDVVPHSPRRFGRAVYKCYYQSFDARIFHTEYARSQISRQIGVVSDSSLVVPHGIYDIFNIDNLTREQARKALGLPVSGIGPIVLAFGNIEDRKGIVELLDAHVRLSADGVEITTVIAGRRMFDVSSELVRALSADRVPDGVILVDERIPFDTVQQYFAACDVVVLPYHEGSTSGVLKLAVAFGKPVVAAPVGDLRNEVTRQLGVLMSERWDADELAQSLAIVFNNLDRYSDSVAVEAQRYSWAPIARSVLSLVDSIDGPRRFPKMKEDGASVWR